jgi:hypothetical protein
MQGGGDDRSLPRKAAGGKGGFDARVYYRTSLLLGPDVGNVNGALAIFKTLDVTGVGGVGK